jgi:predicted nucleic acid-binding Zn ribbon protein
MAFNRLFDILRQAGRTYPLLNKRIEEAEALARWEEAVGSTIAKHSRAVRVLDGVLWVDVDHAVWKSELHHRKRQILDILNARQPGKPATEVLKDILFR